MAEYLIKLMKGEINQGTKIIEVNGLKVVFVPGQSIALSNELNVQLP